VSTDAFTQKHCNTLPSVPFGPACFDGRTTASRV
jgi:hypothetical protein